MFGKNKNQLHEKMKTLEAAAALKKYKRKQDICRFGSERFVIRTMWRELGKVEDGLSWHTLFVVVDDGKVT